MIKTKRLKTAHRPKLIVPRITDNFPHVIKVGAKWVLRYNGTPKTDRSFETKSAAIDEGLRFSKSIKKTLRIHGWENQEIGETPFSIGEKREKSFRLAIRKIILELQN